MREIVDGFRRDCGSYRDCQICLFGITWIWQHAPDVCLVLEANSRLRPGALLLPGSSPGNADCQCINRNGWKDYLAAHSTPAALSTMIAAVHGR